MYVLVGEFVEDGDDILRREALAVGPTEDGLMHWLEQVKKDGPVGYDAFIGFEVEQVPYVNELGLVCD